MAWALACGVLATTERGVSIQMAGAAARAARPSPGRTTGSAARASGPSRVATGSLDRRARRRGQARHLDLLAVDHGADPRGDLVLPVVGLVDRVVEPLALRLALEAADPDVDGLVFLAHEAAQDDHAHLDLERDDLLLHALHPRLLLSGTDVVLPELEEHAGLLGSSGLPGQHTANPGRGTRHRPERV